MMKCKIKPLSIQNFLNVSQRNSNQESCRHHSSCRLRPMEGSRWVKLRDFYSGSLDIKIHGVKKLISIGLR